MAKARPIKGIDCNGSALVGIRLVLTERFDEMCALKKEALNWRDPEGVHSMRVASRRLRGALRDFRPYVSDRRLNSTLKQIRNIGDALGQVRDQDVAILALKKLSSETPPEVSKALKNISAERKANLGSSRNELRKDLFKARLDELDSDFRGAVMAATESNKSGEASPSYVEVARQIINDRLSELEKLSESLYTPLDGKALHEMRIAVKRLRYAIELFHNCWGRHLLPFAKVATRIQNSLGDLHDCDVWIEKFGQLMIESRQSESAENNAAHLWLFKHFVKLRNRHFQRAFTQWQAWETKMVSSRLRDAIKAEELEPDLEINPS